MHTWDAFWPDWRYPERVERRPAAVVPLKVVCRSSRVAIQHEVVNLITTVLIFLHAFLLMRSYRGVVLSVVPWATPVVGLIPEEGPEDGHGEQVGGVRGLGRRVASHA